MFDLFISHCASDKEWVSHFVETLNQRTADKKLAIWFDEHRILAGDIVLQKIEEGIVNSRYIGIVLSPESIRSNWVNFERVIFQSLDPMGKQKKIIPILLKDCDLPIALKAIKYVDFRKPENFDAGINHMIQVLDQPTLVSGALFEKINAIIKESKSFNRNSNNYSYELSDSQCETLYQVLEGININNKEGKEILLKAFLEILSYRDYFLTLTTSEYIAAMVLKSKQYNWILTELLENNDWVIKLAAIRSYSKLAEIDEDAVDSSQLIKCILRLDTKNFLAVDERTAVGHLIRTIGKINRTSKGHSIIRFLSTKGQVSKEICANIIPFDFANNPPIYLTALLKNKSSKIVESIPPNKDQIDILYHLLNDTNGGVRQAAEECLKELKRNWKNLNLEHREVNELTPPVMEAGIPVRFAFGTPFSGFLCRVNKQNEYGLKGNLRQGTIVLIESSDVLEIYFKDASGIIVNDGGSLSHRCLRLRGMGVPFAGIDFDLINHIPDGTFISVNGRSLEFDANKSIVYF